MEGTTDYESQFPLYAERVLFNGNPILVTGRNKTRLSKELLDLGELGAVTLESLSPLYRFEAPEDLEESESLFSFVWRRHSKD